MHDPFWGYPRGLAFGKETDCFVGSGLQRALISRRGWRGRLDSMIAASRMVRVHIPLPAVRPRQRSWGTSLPQSVTLSMLLMIPV